MVQLSVITVVVDVAGGGEREEGAHSDKTKTKPVLTIRSAAGLQADNSSPSVLAQFRGYFICWPGERERGREGGCGDAIQLAEDDNLSTMNHRGI